MIKKLKEVMRRAEQWPEQAQEELAQLGEEIDQELRRGEYDATREELHAIDEAIAEIEQSGVATEIRYAVLYTIREGLILDVREYTDRDHALKAVGLAE